MLEKTNEQLKAMPHESLWYLFRLVRSQLSRIYHYAGRRCCEECHDYIGDDWENDVGKPAMPVKAYFERVKAELQSRPYMSFTKKAKSERSKARKGDLRGNRNQPRNRHHRKPCGLTLPV